MTPPFIPPRIWTMAVTLGHARAAWIETRNPNLLAAILKLETNIEQYLTAVREASKRGG